MKKFYSFHINANLFFSLALLLVVFQSCKKNDVQDIAPAATDNIAALQQAVASSVGMPAGKVVYLQSEKQFVVDGDSYVTLADAKARFAANPAGRSAVNGANQMISYYTILPEKVSTIKIYADATVPATWVAALDSAIKNWNTAGTKVQMQRITTSTGATTKVTTTNNTTSTIASSAYPDYYGNPGNKITINTYYNTMVDSKKIFAITHELGHSLGFSHTNGTYGYLVTGTPTSDPGSIMNASVLYWVGFTANDLLAVNTVYPTI
jgi:hypothetical protein